MTNTLTKTVRAGALATLLAATAPAPAAPARTSAPPQDQPAAPAQAAQPVIEQWGDEFDGDKLDESKWDVYTFDGSGGVTVEVKDKQLRMHGSGESRGGVRTKTMFRADRFLVEASLAKVGGLQPRPGQPFPPGFAVLTVLFNGNPKDRIEWILRSDGMFEAWQSVDGRMEQLDDRKLATKEKNPRLGIARRGDQVFFMLNGQVGMERSLRGLRPDFKVMLYGFGTSQNDWDAITVQTLKQQ
jgi:hypothetical protein